MNSKRSYLDAVNDGRQRRTYASLEQLNRSMESLEQRLGRREEGTELRQASVASTAAIPQRMEPAAAEQPYQSIARDMERVRKEQDSVAAVGAIAGELKGLREELRSQMTSGLQREFDSLRKDFQNISTRGGDAAGKLGRDVERLSSAVQLLGERSDDRTLNMLRLEVEQMKSALDPLAREETVRSVDRRWEDFSKRFNDFENKVAKQPENLSTNAEIVALTERVEQIGRAVTKLPESLSLRSMEDKVRTLATALDQFIEHQNGRASQTFVHIEERLDEISRAIVGATVAAQQHADPEAFQRIEARIAALARQIEEVSEDRADTQMLEQMQVLAKRVDGLAAQNTLPEEVVDRLAYQISVIADKIDHAPAMPNLNEVLSGIDQRFDVMSKLFARQQDDAAEKGQALFRDLERRLNEVAQRMDGGTTSPLNSDAIMRATNEAIRGLETRLENISKRLDNSVSQFAGIDPELVRSLEAQVSGLSQHLARPGTPLPEFVDISPRLREIEKTIAESRESVLEAARSAAEAAARSLAASQPEAGQVAGLAEDLKALEKLTRLSDERNSKTFEAIHDTLLKIVDRMGSLERSGSLPARKLEVRDAPSIAPGVIHSAAEPGDAGEFQSPITTVERTPAQAASAAALAALGEAQPDERPENPGRVRSMFGSLTRALGRKEGKPAGEPALAGSSLPAAALAPDTESALEIAPAVALDTAVDLDAPLDPKIANTPLEPGSGAPDLNAIMKRVRDERAPAAAAKANEADAGKSDFIAAARRAAQAAAAEADVKRRKADLGSPVRALRIGDLLKSRRKHLLLGAAALMTAIAGVQYGPALLSGSTQQATVAAPVPAERVAAAPQKADVPSAADASTEENATSSSYMVGPANAATMNDVASFGTPDEKIASAFAAEPPAADKPATDSLTVAAVAPAMPVDGAEEPVRFDAPASVGPAALRDAASAGDPLAFYEIGNRYAEGKIVGADMAEAARWYERAAELGFAPAQYRVGNMYEKGVGVAQDLTAARKWYEQAAGSGNAPAMHNLAVLFAMGANGKADNDAAAKWFVQAAELGVKDSQFNLGILAAKGAGVPQSLEESYKWFALVAEDGDRDAANKRDEIAKALRPEQLKRARDAAALWKPRPLDNAANIAEIPAEWQGAGSQKTASAEPEASIRTVQQVLNKQGYDAGSADGVMGARTKAAVRQFQSDNGMNPTGAVDQALVSRLTALN